MYCCPEHLHQISLDRTARSPAKKGCFVLDAIRQCCAGLDVHQATIVACLLKGPLDTKPTKQIREFPTVLSGLLSLADWLEHEGCTDVAMESTGVFWKPVFNVLQDSCSLTVANAAHVKNIKGRKTDVKDAEWLAQLHRCDLIRSSFVPPQEIRNLRDLTRYRKKLKGHEASERNRIHKVLEDANIKLSSFVSDLFGVSGRLMLQAIVNGEVLEPDVIADLAKGKLRAKLPELTAALNGRVTKHHRQMISHSLKHLAFLESSIAELEAEMDIAFAPHLPKLSSFRAFPVSVPIPPRFSSQNSGSICLCSRPLPILLPGPDSVQAVTKAPVKKKFGYPQRQLRTSQRTRRSRLGRQ